MPAQLAVRLPGPLRRVVVAGGGDAATSQPASGSADLQARLAAATQAQAAKLKTAIAGVEQAAAELNGARMGFLKEAESQVVELSLAIARKVLMQEIQDGRYKIEPLVREALLSVPARQDVVVHLNPDDHAQCDMVRDAGTTDKAGIVRFVADPSVQRGGCLLETPDGVVEATLETNMESVTEALRSLQ